jgi:hypothetical protein
MFVSLHSNYRSYEQTTFLWQCLNPSREAQHRKLTSPWDHRLVIMAPNLDNSNNRNWIYKCNIRLLSVTVRHELSSLALTLGSWVRIPLRAWMFGVCMLSFCVCVVLCLGRSLATSWSLVQGVVPSVKNDYGIEWEAWALNGLEEPFIKTVASLHVLLSRNYIQADPIGPTVAPLLIECYL